MSSYQNVTERTGPPRGARHPRRRLRQPGHQPADPGGQPHPGQARSHPAKRERHPGHGPAPAAGAEDYDLINAGKQPVTLLPAARIPPRRQLRHDARRPSWTSACWAPSRCRPRATWPTGARASPAPSRRGRRDGPAGHRCQADLGDDGFADQTGRQQDRHAMHLSAHGHRLRQAHLHRPVHLACTPTGPAAHRQPCPACWTGTNWWACRYPPRHGLPCPQQSSIFPTNDDQAFIVDAIRPPSAATAAPSPRAHRRPGRHARSRP